MILSSRRIRFSVSIILCLLAFQAIILGEVRGTYTISISNTSVSVTIQTSFLNNFTFSQVPAYSLTLVGSNASAAEAAFTSALSSLVPGVTIRGLEITSSSKGNLTRTTVTFNVEGVATSERGTVKINMAWKAFKVSTDIQSGGISINQVGRYLDSSPVLNHNSTSFFTWTYFVDLKPISSASSVQAASNFTLLDLSQLSTPLQSWSQRLSLEGGPTTTLTNTVNHNMTVKEVIRDPSGDLIGIFLAGYSHNVKISAAGPATIQGDSIILDASPLSSMVMASLIVIFPVLGLTTFFLERRISGGSRPWAKKNRQRSKGSPTRS